MPIRVRKFIGMIVIVTIMVFYAMISMLVAIRYLMDAPHAVQALYFLVAGTAWALPVMPVIRWMSQNTANS